MLKSSPHPDNVQAFVARCLVDPPFLSAAMQNDDGSGRGAILFDRSELDRLALFQAFIVKVKHNGVRDVLPITFRMLAALGEELAFYRFHAAEYLAIRAAGPLPLQRQVQLMTDSLRRYLGGSKATAQRALSDVVTHELTIWRMLSDQRVHDYRVGHDVPAWLGRMKIKRYTTDIARVAKALTDGTFDPTRDADVPDLAVAYWLPRGGSSVDSFEIDELTATLFSMTDGRKTLDTIADELAAIGLDQIDIADVRRFFDELAERGFVASCAGVKAPERLLA